MPNKTVTDKTVTGNASDTNISDDNGDASYIGNNGVNDNIDILVNYPEWGASIPDIDVFTRNIVATVLSEFEPPFGQIDIMFCDDDTIHDLNKTWRGHDKPTNVLSFEAVSDDIMGNIAIAHDYCAREAIDQNKTFRHHIAHMLVHGVLHLMGYDHLDEDEAQEMEGLEIEILQKLGINNPYILDAI